MAIIFVNPVGLHLHWCYVPTLVASSLALFWLFSFFLSTCLQSPTIGFSPAPEKTTLTSTTVTSDPCHGRYVYVHRLPSRFNTDLLPNDCRKYRSSGHSPELCMFSENYGMGPPVDRNGDGKVVLKKGWYVTNQFALDAIFYHRMKHYRCLTANSSMAAAVYVPFLAGLDIGRHLWRYNTSVRDALSSELVELLVTRPEWKRMYGKDHFMVAGRITYDFRRHTDNDSDWGNRLLLYPAAKNMTMLDVETSSYYNNDISIPYPTYFHPSKLSQVQSWQRRVRRSKRPWLFTFTGARRPNSTSSIRDQLISQCHTSKRALLLQCDSSSHGRCYQPEVVMKTFQSSVFCLQPAGDSYTRRSTFDSILAGCIPVFFHPSSAYTQYTWYLPQDYRAYSVFIPESDVRDGKVSIEEVLLEIPDKSVRKMREVVIGLIPKIVYADPRSKWLGRIEDAFDLAVRGVIERVENVKGRGVDHGVRSEGEGWTS